MKDRDETIVKMWCAGASVKDIATAVESPEAGVYVRISKLRKMGVAIPPRNARRPVDVAALNKLIKRAS